jgi:hypothetical protein
MSLKSPIAVERAAALDTAAHEDQAWLEARNAERATAAAADRDRAEKRQAERVAEVEAVAQKECDAAIARLQKDLSPLLRNAFEPSGGERLTYAEARKVRDLCFRFEATIRENVGEAANELQLAMPLFELALERYPVAIVPFAGTASDCGYPSSIGSLTHDVWKELKSDSVGAIVDALETLAQAIEKTAAGASPLSPTDPGVEYARRKFEARRSAATGRRYALAVQALDVAWSEEQTARAVEGRPGGERHKQVSWWRKVTGTEDPSFVDTSP